MGFFKNLSKEIRENIDRRSEIRKIERDALYNERKLQATNYAKEVAKLEREAREAKLRESLKPKPINQKFGFLSIDKPKVITSVKKKGKRTIITRTINQNNPPRKSYDLIGFG